MVLFKINGERNSGTNFLNTILRVNNFPVYEQEIINNVCKQWKHGLPRKENKLLDNKVIDIFIFRSLDEWLVSMYHNCYHLEPKNNFTDFLTIKQKSIETYLLDYKTNKCLNADDNGKTIFEIRYYKFKKIMEYIQKNKNIVLVNLTFLQNKKNLLYFLNQLNNIYMNNSISTHYILKIPHTKINTNIQNRKYSIDLEIYKNIINKYKNEEIESFINNLTCSITYKSGNKCILKIPHIEPLPIELENYKNIINAHKLNEQKTFIKNITLTVTYEL